MKPLLASLLLLLALPTLAEQKYYTWVDAQGNIQNTPIASEAEPKPATSNLQALDPEDYPSEEEYQQNINNTPDGEKPFYTWMGPDGVIRNDVKPDTIIEFSATEPVYDASFAPPFRLPSYVTEGLCCEDYSQYFTTKIRPAGSVTMAVEKGSQGFETAQGLVSAAYFSFEHITANEIVTIKAYKLPADSRFELIALNKDFKPLYLASEVPGTFVEQTWKDKGYKKFLLEVLDSDIKHMIVFMKNQQGLAQSDYSIAIVRDLIISP